MRWFGIVAALATCACGGKGGDCKAVAAKVRPVIAKLLRDAGKPASDAKLDDLAGEMCTKPVKEMSASERRFFDCVLAATTESQTAACLEVEFAAYRDDTKAVVERSNERLRQLEAERAKLDELMKPTAPPPAVRDAGLDAAAAPAAKPPIDVATLTAWPVPANVRGKGPDVELYAVDTSADHVLVQLWDAGPLLAPATGKKLTGKLVAPSRAAAFAAAAAQAGFEARTPKLAGHGVAVDLDFGGAPQRDLFRLLADVLRVNIVVAPGALPDLDIVVKRAPGDAVLAATAALDDRAVIRDGRTLFVVPRGTKLPAAPRATGKATVELYLHDATATEAFAALRAVATLPVGACGGEKVTLRLAHLTAGEAARAIVVATGAPLVPGGGPCTVPEASDANGAHLVAIARAGGAGAAVIEKGQSPMLVKASRTVEIGATAITVNKQPISFATDPQPLELDLASWLASLRRTSLVLRIGKDWSALVETSGSPVMVGARAFAMPFELRVTPPAISAKGIEIHGTSPDPIIVPLAAP